MSSSRRRATGESWSSPVPWLGYAAGGSLTSRPATPRVGFGRAADPGADARPRRDRALGSCEPSSSSLFASRVRSPRVVAGSAQPRNPTRTGCAPAQSACRTPSRADRRLSRAWRARGAILEGRQRRVFRAASREACSWRRAFRKGAQARDPGPGRFADLEAVRADPRGLGWGPFD
jgi:hypothetical protein